MIIAVESGLEGIVRGLREKGYTVVRGPDYNTPVDVFIYKEGLMTKGPTTLDITNLDNSSAYYGVLMINANNKSLEEIENILKNRLYSPLF